MAANFLTYGRIAFQPLVLPLAAVQTAGGELRCTLHLAPAQLGSVVLENFLQHRKPVNFVRHLSDLLARPLQVRVSNNTQQQLVGSDIVPSPLWRPGKLAQDQHPGARQVPHLHLLLQGFGRYAGRFRQQTSWRRPKKYVTVVLSRLIQLHCHTGC